MNQAALRTDHVIEFAVYVIAVIGVSPFVHAPSLRTKVRTGSTCGVDG